MSPLCRQFVSVHKIRISSLWYKIGAHKYYYCATNSIPEQRRQHIQLIINSVYIKYLAIYMAAKMRTMARCCTFNQFLVEVCLTNGGAGLVAPATAPPSPNPAALNAIRNVIKNLPDGRKGFSAVRESSQDWG